MFSGSIWQPNIQSFDAAVPEELIYSDKLTWRMLLKIHQLMLDN
jgi:hypothetical protein